MWKIIRLLVKVIRGSLFTRNWTVYYFPHADVKMLTLGLPLGECQVLRPRNSWRYFWADPCLSHDEDGQPFLLVECFDRLTGNGHIQRIVLGTDVIRVNTLLKSKHHFAFPKIVHLQGAWLVTVDGCGSEVAWIYEGSDLKGSPRAIDLPANLTDPIISKRGGQVVLLGTDWTIDERWHSVYFETGSFNISGKIDWSGPYNLPLSMWGRSGGDYDEPSGLRAVQNADGPYGLYVDLLAVDPTPGGHQRRVLRRLGGDVVGEIGVHTVSWNGTKAGVAVDGWKYRFDVLGWFWHVRELRHLKVCRRESLKSPA